MTRRVLGAPLLLALGVLGAVWFAGTTFTTTASVTAIPPDFTTSGEPAPDQPEVRRMHLRCGRDGDYYVSEAGALLFFNEVTWTYPPPEPPCDAARADRRLVAIAFGVVAAFAGLVLIADGRIRQRRQEVSAQAPTARARDSAPAV